MSKNDLRIKIVGTLNTGLTIGEINSAIKGIEQKIKPLKLNIQIDERVSKSLTDFSRAMEHHKKISQDLNRVVKEEKTITKEADGVIKEKTRQHLKSGEIIEKEIKRINEQVKATQKQTDETKRLIVETDKLRNKQRQSTKLDGQGNFDGGSVNVGDKFNNTSINYGANNEITSQRTVENIRQQAQALESLRQKLQQISSAGNVTASSLSRMTRAIDGAKTEREIHRIEQALNRVNQRATNNNSLDMFRRQAQINVQNIQRTHGGFVDNVAMQNYLSAVNSLSSRTPNLTQRMKELNMQFREVSINAKGAAGAAQQAGMSFGEMFSTAMIKFPIWIKNCPE